MKFSPATLSTPRYGTLGPDIMFRIKVSATSTGKPAQQSCHYRQLPSYSILSTLIGRLALSKDLVKRRHGLTFRLVLSLAMSQVGLIR
jgi:hypothetical protein